MNGLLMPRRQKKLSSKYVFLNFSSAVSEMQHLKSSSGLSAILVHKNIYILVWDCMECHGGAYHACQWSHFIVFELICCYSLLGGNYVLWSTGHFLFLTGAYQHKLSVAHTEQGFACQLVKSFLWSLCCHAKSECPVYGVRVPGLHFAYTIVLLVVVDGWC